MLPESIARAVGKGEYTGNRNSIHNNKEGDIMSATAIGLHSSPLTVVPDARLTDKVKFLSALSIKKNGVIRTKISGMAKSTATWFGRKANAFKSSAWYPFSHALAWVGIVSSYKGIVRGAAKIIGGALSFARRAFVAIGHAFDSALGTVARLVGKINKKAGAKMIDFMCDMTDKRMNMVDKATASTKKFGRNAVEKLTGYAPEFAYNAAASVVTIARIHNVNKNGAVALKLASSSSKLAKISRLAITSNVAGLAILLSVSLITAVLTIKPQPASAENQTVAVAVVDNAKPADAKMATKPSPATMPKQRTETKPAEPTAKITSAKGAIVVEVENAESAEEARKIAEEQMQAALKRLEAQTLQRKNAAKSHGPRGKRRR